MMFQKRKYRAGRVAQVVQYLPSKPEALSSNPSNPKKKKKGSPEARCFDTSFYRPGTKGVLMKEGNWRSPKDHNSKAQIQRRQMEARTIRPRSTYRG
jgi:hypothetical protein